MYICDRFIVPRLSPEQQAQIGTGALSLDRLTRRYIHDKLAYRYVITPTPVEARTLERQVQSGALQAGSPFLNPLRGTPSHMGRGFGDRLVGARGRALDVIGLPQQRADRRPRRFPIQCHYRHVAALVRRVPRRL